LTGFAFGGNKTRKLDYLINEALENGADTIVAVGAYQSNFCRIASAYGAANGLEVWLVLGGKKPEKATANLMLDYLFGAKVKGVESSEWNDWETEAEKLKNELVAKNRNVYCMPIGGSTTTGALGYIDCIKEIVGFSNTKDIHFSNIFHATGSAGTQAGLVVGKTLTEWNGIINGIAVTKDSKQIFNEVKALANDTAALFNVDIKDIDIVVDDNYIGEAYGAETESAKEAISLFAKLEGILLDNVYTGKAAAGMIDFIRNSKFKKSDNILFIHTGGNIQLFI
jgi:1-aminocyclopropane-1-carboxylate deaminase/D-cysteine desulfhydrase-like pyridoxal-dependent ACC family enzyme